MKVSFRDYIDSDYESCEALVNDAWKFDLHFKPQDLSNVAQYMYTKGSVTGSNFKRVVEIDGKVTGFIFGLNEMSPKPEREALFELKILKRIVCIKGMAFRDKKKLLRAINSHELNRSKIAGKGKSEIILFVVDPACQGIGIGKKLLSAFITQCKSSGVKSVIVETNKLGASSFYEGIGFRHMGNFYSPLHEYATKDGQACMYECRCD
ncbi:MAG: GNAT family N-acetyltransferase [Gammaproteobacteria bacterium]|nr:GNAT family N-acetyltransferase [Gammaproteobacteria bacterium]